MRLLLTSAGLANGSIQGAFAELVGRPFEETAVGVVLTASLALPGNKRWRINKLARLDRLGLRQIDLLHSRCFHRRRSRRGTARPARGRGRCAAKRMHQARRG